MEHASGYACPQMVREVHCVTRGSTSSSRTNRSSEVGKGLLISLGNNLNFRRQAFALAIKAKFPKTGFSPSSICRFHELGQNATLQDVQLQRTGYRSFWDVAFSIVEQISRRLRRLFQVLSESGDGGSNQRSVRPSRRLCK